MSGWSRPQGSSQSGGIDLLKIIPGYSGYRAKEGRRDEDKRVRTELARQYETIAQELGAQQGELVRAQRFVEIGSVERLERALRLFIDRLRTATYGYGGLFSDNPIDEHALDACAEQEIKPIVEQRPAVNGHEALRIHMSQRTQARPLSSRKE